MKQHFDLLAAAWHVLKLCIMWLVVTTITISDRSFAAFAFTFHYFFQFGPCCFQRAPDSLSLKLCLKLYDAVLLLLFPVVTNPYCGHGERFHWWCGRQSLTLPALCPCCIPLQPPHTLQSVPRCGQHSQTTGGQYGKVCWRGKWLNKEISKRSINGSSFRGHIFLQLLPTMLLGSRELVFYAGHLVLLSCKL
jgi:hypothetical protein